MPGRQATVLAGDPVVAEDVVQDVLVKAHERWHRISGLGLHGPEPVADATVRIDQRAVLVQLIRALPPRQRIVIALRSFEDMADGDIAAVMGCTIANVRSQASRALATLRTVAPGGEP